MKPVRICLVGATGLVGSRLIHAVVGRADLRIVGVARREMPLPPGAQMEMLVAEPWGWADAIAASNANVLVCALGTTIRAQGGDQAAFRAIDHDLVLDCARAAKTAGIGHMVLVSSVGADRASRNFYLRVKGETEDALAKLHFTRLDILRPALLRGPRAERRPAERLAMILNPLIDPFLRGGLRRFHSIKADTMVQAVIALAKEKAGGRFVHEYDAMRYAIRRARG
ncbi:NAD(P)H-binding protein [Novosphingobium sp. G106]|uniref:NAD(P)H-binding protein n=1 Tax=Novosphingobium sp. G106 TaxID=2849500 RepID=UPI001C2CF021|nr:NAD(P)H-binding protein [Novosphingobium sp. G106]MBV1688031.1 NAD(P)H-binding protein [Novosphingobium sp. G106]